MTKNRVAQSSLVSYTALTTMLVWRVFLFIYQNVCYYCYTFIFHKVDKVV